MTRSRSSRSYPSGVDEFWLATLSGDRAQANRVRQGLAIVDDQYFDVGDWAAKMQSFINPAILYGQLPFAIADPPPDISPDDDTSVAEALALLLRIRAPILPRAEVRRIIAILEDYHLMSPEIMLVVTYWNPEALLSAEKWHDPARFAEHRAQLHLIMDHAVDRLDRSLRNEWDRLRAKLLGANVPLRRAADERLTERLLEMLMSVR